MVHVLEYWEHNQYTHSCLCQLGLCIIYFKRYNTYHDTYEAIFDMYQRYILSGFRPKQMIYPHFFSQEFGNFNDQNILNLSKDVSFEVLSH